MASRILLYSGLNPSRLCRSKSDDFETMNQQTDKFVRRITMVATVTASYFLLTADYGPEPNVLDPIKKAILSAESSLKEFVFGSKKERDQESSVGKLHSEGGKDHP